MPDLRKALECVYAKHVLPAHPDQQGAYALRLQNQIVAKVVGWVGRLRKVDDWAAQFHCHTLKTVCDYIQWGNIKSGQCCLFCLFNRPEHVLECRHSICDSCVQRLGERQYDQEHAYIMPSCVLCGTRSSLQIRLKPPTAGVRILSLDGGGIRGVILLEIINLLESSMGGGSRIQDFFDVALGTSVGE